ncbi:hypothetical protein [Streptomyces rishiriensis]|uniref:Uncharacterized protein n=1 Tax=Streptomyces rishiriensis TaxID=68264 RepID=A0ABU0P1E8_STRRH|nr:hypothetical protein [Streptomyces rishiriensis]MDQ0585206.1 hypothetical protein [Streptomyces rishiriensis]
MRQVEVASFSGDARAAAVSTGGGATRHTFPATGDRGTVARVHAPVTPKAGAGTITSDSGSGHAPDVDRTDVPQTS